MLSSAVSANVCVRQFSVMPELLNVVAFAVRTFVCIAILNDNLVRISVKFRAKLPSGGNDDSSGSAGDDCMMVEDCCDGDSDVVEKRCTLTPLAAMSSARCGLGTAVLNGQLVAVGRLSHSQSQSDHLSCKPGNVWAVVSVWNISGNWLKSCWGKLFIADLGLYQCLVECCGLP